MRNHDILFDHSQKQVSFAKADCSGNIVYYDEIEQKKSYLWIYLLICFAVFVLFILIALGFCYCKTKKQHLILYEQQNMEKIRIIENQQKQVDGEFQIDEMANQAKPLDEEFNNVQMHSLDDIELGMQKQS
eukprot:TRINITY_DN18957_c0_g1_i1.p3 TRINITY_DN18957_c0_g1~~TRINITY_DN18957_c0_g1_i1.p3  ORF type:complete len:131 (-),score=35.25 TRINITY_DN18957_c0_g1_i1:78-470(-)